MSLSTNPAPQEIKWLEVDIFAHAQLINHVIYQKFILKWDVPIMNNFIKIII